MTDASAGTHTSGSAADYLEMAAIETSYNGGGAAGDGDDDQNTSPLGQEVTALPGTAAAQGGVRGTVWTYLKSKDFREIVACAVFLFLCCIIYLVDPEPHERPIPFQFLQNSQDYVRNLVNNENFHGDTVSSALLHVLAEIIPIVAQFVVSKLYGHAGDAHATICVYFVALGINALATDAVKLYVGYLRPIFYYLCEPDDTYEECTGSDAADGRVSFPSGHASTAFCGLLLLTLYLHNRFGIPSVRVYKQDYVDDAQTVMRWTPTYIKEPMLYRFVSVACLAPLALALFIAVSRVYDNKHFPADVVGGSILGASSALFTYGLWFA